MGNESVGRDAASTYYSADCRSDSLTEGYKNKFPLFHKLFLSDVENFLKVAAKIGSRHI